MTTAEVNQMIESTGIPSAYRQFTKATAKEPPFICFYYPGDHDMIADNVNFATINELIVELYTDNKDFNAEAVVEAALKDAGLSWSRQETYIDAEKMYMVAYSTEVLINES